MTRQWLGRTAGDDWEVTMTILGRLAEVEAKTADAVDVDRVVKEESFPLSRLRQDHVAIKRIGSIEENENLKISWMLDARVRMQEETRDEEKG